jgi:hypothetical protein
VGRREICPLPLEQIMSAVAAIPFSLPTGFAMAGASSEDAIRQVWERDNAAYGDANIGLDALRSWFAGYQAGGLYVWNAGRIVAGVGLWPLREESYAALRLGTLGEDSVGPADFPVMGEGRTCGYWNLSGFFVESKYRRSVMLPALLSEAFYRWERSGDAAPRCAILGLGMSAAGARTMANLGFVPVPPPIPGLPRYEMRIGLPSGCAALQARIANSYAHRLAVSPS